MAFLLASQLFPSIMLLIPFYKIYMTFGLINTHAALIITYVSFTIPFCTWMMRGYFDGISKDLDLAAQKLKNNKERSMPMATKNLITKINEKKTVRDNVDSIKILCL